MTTMRDSRMPADWIARSVAANPIRQLENGNYISGPVRLAFINFFEPKKGQSDDGSSKESYQCAALLPPGAEGGINSVLYAAWYHEAKRIFPNNFRPDGQPFGLHWPFHLCDDKQQYAGYTPGLYYVNLSSQFKPQVVDSAMNPIVDPARVYPGVWAILALNIYSYGVSPPRPKKGLSFGLQNVMLIADDEKLAGGGTDPEQDFAGVQIDARYDVAAAFGGVPGAPPPPPSSVMPPSMPVPGFRPPVATPPAPMAAPVLDYDPMS